MSPSTTLYSRFRAHPFRPGAHGLAASGARAQRRPRLAARPRAFGRVLLRIEDHDRARCRPEYKAAILDDLDWLGLAPDMFPTGAFRHGRCDGRQSDATPSIGAAGGALRARGLVYGCDCTRREIASHSTDQPELHYNGRCRDRGAARPTAWSAGA